MLNTNYHMLTTSLLRMNLSCYQTAAYVIHHNTKNGSISDCINVSGPNGEWILSRMCLLQETRHSYFSSDDIYKRHIEDSKTLFLAVQSVMEGKGNTENINEAILKLNSEQLFLQSFTCWKNMFMKEKIMAGPKQIEDDVLLDLIKKFLMMNAGEILRN